jgi:hypothetical protein
VDDAGFWAIIEQFDWDQVGDHDVVLGPAIHSPPVRVRRSGGRVGVPSSRAS